MAKQTAIADGFDQTTKQGQYLRIRCSQCEATCINGIACHETGCPNQTYECLGCNARVPRVRMYCADCQ